MIFDAGDPFLLGLVREHRAGDDVADRVDAFDVGAEMFVHLDPLLFVELDADFLRADSFGERSAADRDQHFVGFEFQFFAAFGRGGDRAAVLDLHRADFGFEMKRHSLRGERALQQIRQFEIETERDARQKFQHRHFRAEPAPNRAELETDRARADDEKFLRRLRRNESASVLLTIVLPSNFANGNSTGTLPVAMTMFFVSISCVSPAVRFDRNFAGRGDRSEAFERRDLVRLHQRAHAAGHAFSRPCLCAEASSPDRRATLSITMPCLAASFFANMK